MKLAVALLLLLAAGLLAAAAEPLAATHAFRQGAPTNSSSFGIMPVASAVSVTAILAAGVAAAVFLLLDKWWRSAAARQQCDRRTPQQAKGLQAPPPRCAVQPKRGLPQVPGTTVAARATSLQPPPRTTKAVSLQLSHSMPAAVSPFAAAAIAAPAQPVPAAAPAAQPPPHAQQSPFAAAAVQPSQPKQLSLFAGATQQRAALAAAAMSPFAAEASALSGTPSAASSEASQLPSSGSAASELARRPSPPHLSTMLDALPMFSAVPDGSSMAQGVTAGPPAAPAASLPGQRPRSPGGRHPPIPRLSKDRISLEQLRSEILGDEARSCSEAQLASVLSTGLPAAGAAAAGAAAAGAAAAGSAPGGAQQPAGGSPGISLPPSPSCGHDSDWEIAPNELEVCKRPDGSLWQLGAGGFGRVYKAMRFGCTPVAVKVLAPTSDPTPGLFEDFKREARLLQRCKDPHIVSFLGASLNSDFTILVTEYCEGGSLSANLAAGRISWYRHGKQVALDVARGLVFLHCRSILHFDLKSPNILLDRRGTAKIADLGLAKIMHHERSSVSGNLGTLNWAAPELLLGQPCNSAADIWSFGALLWEICTGAVPVRGRMRPLAVPDDCPAEVARLVEECTSADPQARPTAQELVECLLAAPGSPPQRAVPAAAAADFATLTRRGSDLSSRVGSAGQLASPSSPPGAMGRPPRPRSETNLPALAAQHALAAAPAAHAAQPAPPAQPALPAVREEAEQLPQQAQQARLEQQPAAHMPSPRPTSPLPSALSVASDSALTGALSPVGQVAAAVVAAQHMERGSSLPVPQWGDQYGLGFC